MKALVCGGRTLEREPVKAWLEEHMGGARHWTKIIHGGAKGADIAAGEWAEEVGIPVEVYKADWTTHGKAAGPRRNKRMLEEGKPDVVVAFPGGRGTENMIEQALEAGVRIVRAVI